MVAKADGTYAYFTSNGTPGGVFMYKLGQKNVTLLYRPQKGQQNYNMASVVAAADGSLYFVNDSGYLFKIGSQSVGGTLPDQATGKSVNQKDQEGEKDGNAGTTPGGGKNAGSGSGATGGGSGSASAGSTSSGSVAGGGKAAQSSGKAGAVKASKTVTGKASPADGGKSAASGPLALLRGVASDVLTVTTEDGASASVGTGAGAGTAHGGSAKASAGQGSLGTGGLPIWPIVGMALGAAAFVAAVLRRRNDGDKTDAGAR